MSALLQTHLATGATHVCHCWSIHRRDGLRLGFTDHDRPIRFDDFDFTPESGLTARALANTTGLSVNNSEAVGVLQAEAITEADIDAGRYDGAEVAMWLVQWDDPTARQLRFRGTIGEITRAAGGFQAELRGLTEGLNQPQGRSYIRTCSAVLGDARCRFDIADPRFSAEVPIAVVTDEQTFVFQGLDTYNARWFEGGFLEALSGSAVGLTGVVKQDLIQGDRRVITLWEPLRAPVEAQDQIRLIAGCDKRVETCRQKFDNIVNFQGFPDIPGDDWLISGPQSAGNNSGGSRSR